jgi:hypothetical protein
MFYYWTLSCRHYVPVHTPIFLIMVKICAHYTAAHWLRVLFYFIFFFVSFQSVMVMSLNEVVPLFHNVLKHRSKVYLRLGVEENVYFYLDNILAFKFTSN